MPYRTPTYNRPGRPRADHYYVIRKVAGSDRSYLYWYGSFPGGHSLLEDPSEAPHWPPSIAKRIVKRLNRKRDEGARWEIMATPDSYDA